MRVLTVVYDLGMGGTQRAAQNFANAYAGLGHDSHVWAVEALGPREADLAPTVTLHGPGTALDELDALSPDVVHLHGHGLREARIRSLHETSAGRARWIEQNVFALPTPWTDLLDESFVFSQWCARQYAEARGPHAPVRVVANPVDCASFARDLEAGEQFRRDHGVPADACVIGRLGQPQDYKWSPLTVSAFDEIAAEDPSVWLLLVGAPDALAESAACARYRSRITVLPPIVGDQQLAACYSAMDVFGHAALQGETFGYVLAEAMLCEVPVVTLATPWADNSQGEVVGHGQGGLVVTTAKGYGSAVASLASDPALRARMGQTGRSRIKDRYDAVELAGRALQADEGPAPIVPTRVDLLCSYREAADPPGAVRSALFRLGMVNALAWASGVRSLGWLLQMTANRWGFSRRGWSRPARRATG